MGKGLNGGFGGLKKRKRLATTPSGLPENASFKSDYLKKMLFQGYPKNLFIALML